MNERREKEKGNSTHTQRHKMTEVVCVSGRERKREKKTEQKHGIIPLSPDHQQKPQRNLHECRRLGEMDLFQLDEELSGQSRVLFQGQNRVVDHRFVERLN